MEFDTDTGTLTTNDQQIRDIRAFSGKIYNLLNYMSTNIPEDKIDLIENEYYNANNYIRTHILYTSIGKLTIKFREGSHISYTFVPSNEEIKETLIGHNIL